MPARLVVQTSGPSSGPHSSAACQPGLWCLSRDMLLSCHGPCHLASARPVCIRQKGLPSSQPHARAPQHRLHLKCHATGARSGTGSSRNLYELLGVTSKASVREIKAAYRGQALKLHPDVNPAKDAKERFMEAKQAFETLSDPMQRAEYDRRLRMGFGSSAEWRTTGSRSSSQSTSENSNAQWGSTPRQGSKKPEDDYSFDDLIRDIDKELSSWAKERKKGSKGPKSLLEELADLGEEFVDYLEEATGVGKSDDKPKEKERPKTTVEQMDEIWDQINKKYGSDPNSSSSTAAGDKASRVSQSGSASRMPFSCDPSSSSAAAGKGAYGQASSRAGQSTSKVNADDEIELMLAELKRKLKK